MKIKICFYVRSAQKYFKKNNLSLICNNAER